MARFDTDWVVQPQKMTRGLKVWMYEEDGFYVCDVKTQAIISCANIVQLICDFLKPDVLKKQNFKNIIHNFASIDGLS